VQYANRERTGTTETGEPWLGQATRTPSAAANASAAVVENAPPRIFYFGAIGSIIASLGLFLTGKRMEAIFVGHWAPTFLCLGLYSRLMGGSRRMG
jgi:hypothetical protein